MNFEKVFTDNDDVSSKKTPISLKIVNKPSMKSNNDPFLFKSINKDYEFFKSNEISIQEIKDKGYTSSFLDNLKCCNCYKENPNFEKALSLYYYYMDVSTYFRKMVEVDIIKYFLFSINERKLISIISNPDFSTIEKEVIYSKLNEQHDKSKYIKDFDKYLDPILKEVLMEGRNNKEVNKLLRLVQNGNHTLYDI